jgi:putative tryptophan/tyrosine transport system substrate-binding protein
MRRRDLIALLAGTVTTWPRFISAQPRSPRVGILWHAANEEEEAIYLGAVRRGLSDFGFVERTNIILENRFPAEIPERFIS